MTTWNISSRLGMTGTVDNSSGLYLSWSITSPTVISFTFGGPNTIPLVGDWDGNGMEGIGVYAPADGTFFLKQTASAGDADITFQFGSGGQTPISWYDESAIPTHDQIGIISDSTVYLRRSFEPGPADITTITDNIICDYSHVKQCTYIPPSYSSSRSSFSVYETHPYYYNGTFKDLTVHIPSVADLGIDVVYLMPIWKRLDEINRWDIYDILDYYTFDPLLGVAQDVKDLIDTVHSYGMKILFDLVSAETCVGSTIYNNGWTLNIPLTNLQAIAATNGWVLKYDIPNVVYTGKIDNNNYAFYGLIVGSNVISYTSPPIWGPAIDRGNPDVITYFTNMAKYYVQTYDIDGWRIDVPGDSYNKTVFPGNHSSVNFYNSIIAGVKNIKPTAIFISEPTVPAGVVVDMEYAYMPFTGILPDVIGNAITSSQLVDRLLNITTRIPLYVIESHDLPRLSVTYPLYDRNFMVLVSTFYGSPFIQAGQEIGATADWSNEYVDWSDGDISLRNFYKKVLTIRNSSNALKYGLAKSVWKSGNNIYAYSMIYDIDKAVVLINFSGTQTTSTLDMPFVSGDVITDQLSGETFSITDPTSFTINVPAYSSRILMIPPSPSQAGFGLIGMLLVGGLAIGAMYSQTKT
jgi:cyclomaltodextrinase